MIRYYLAGCGARDLERILSYLREWNSSSFVRRIRAKVITERDCPTWRALRHLKRSKK